jgi:hypothetical protein
MVLPEQGADLELRWEVEMDGEGAAVIIDPAGGKEPLARGVALCTSDGELMHVEVRDGAAVLLAATVRVGEEARVLYARTPLLAELGLGGGRYEVV